MGESGFRLETEIFANDEMIYEVNHILNCGYEIK